LIFHPDIGENGENGETGDEQASIASSGTEELVSPRTRMRNRNSEINYPI
jgi:hypothetical protein